MPVLLDTPRRINAVFVGDSITWQWTRNANTFSEDKLLIPFNSAYMTKDNGNVTVKFHPGFFARNGYLDKGISGQNTSQMLERFQKDVVDLNPAVVVIMGGTNDLAQGVSKEQIVANIAAMSEMAQAAGIKVVLCTVTPCNDSYSRLSNPKTKGQHIIWLNEMLKDYADAQGFAWCDYWSALVADDGLALHPNYRLYDNLHPGPDGYDVMEPIIKPIIDSLF
jgi:lysophospholipase L1-like esterase